MATEGDSSTRLRGAEAEWGTRCGSFSYTLSRLQKHSAESIMDRFTEKLLELQLEQCQ